MPDSAVIRSPVLRCPVCGNAFLGVSWLAYRVAGYCSVRCEANAAPAPAPTEEKPAP